MAVEGTAAERWAEPLLELCVTLPRLPNLDPSARLRFVPAGQDLIVEVVLADGRSALRRVTSPAELRFAVEALVTIPPPPSDAAAPPAPSATMPPSASGRPPPPAPSGVALAAGNRPITSAAAPARSARIELGVVARGGLSGAPTYVSVAPVAHAGLRSAGWLLGLCARWQLYGMVAPGDYPGLAMDGAGAGVFATLRVGKGPAWSLDLGPAAWLVMEAQSVPQGGDDEEDDPIAGWAADGRFGLVARALFGRSPWHWLLSADAEVSPARLRREMRIDAALPALPAWGVGLGLGGAWAQP